MKIVVVEWLDSHYAEGGWRFFEDKDACKPIRCFSVGWLKRAKDGVLVLVPHLGWRDWEEKQPGQGCGEMVIPEKAVVSINMLGGAGGYYQNPWEREKDLGEEIKLSPHVMRIIDKMGYRIAGGFRIDVEKAEQHDGPVVFKAADGRMVVCRRAKKLGWIVETGPGEEAAKLNWGPGEAVAWLPLVREVERKG